MQPDNRFGRTILYRTSHTVIAEVLEDVSEAEFVRVKISACLEPKKAFVCLHHQMHKRRIGLRLAITAYWCGVMIDRALGGSAYNDITRSPVSRDVEFRKDILDAA